MTKFLSQALQAPEPFFRQGLARLEAANGHPNTDIRFSTEVTRGSKAKLRELGLDPDDTTPEELYHALRERVKADDKRLGRNLRTLAATYVSAEADVVDGMVHALKTLPDSKRCFGLKSSVLKSIVKRIPPKKAMKQLGYRSLDSFVKHEPPASILSAIYLCEDEHYRKRLADQYRQLEASDFESRDIQIAQLRSDRWQKMAGRIVGEKKHNILCFKEIGALVFLPLPEDAPAGSTVAGLSLALHELNEIRAGSTFLKLCQVRSDFGKIVQEVVGDEPRLESSLLDQPVPWRLIQHYYARLADGIGRSVALEPHLQMEDIAWHPVEKSLRHIEPSLEFWQHSGYLGLMHESKPVSMNIVDTALGACNSVPFENRLSRYFQSSLWHELMLRYLRPEAVEQAIMGELQPRLAEELAVA